MKLSNLIFAFEVHSGSSLTRPLSAPNTSKFFAATIAGFALFVCSLFSIAPSAYAGTVTVNGDQPNLEIETSGGIEISNADKSSVFTVGGRVHVDYTHYEGAFNRTNIDPVSREGENASDFDLRRLRLDLGGHTGNWYFAAGYDFQDNDDRRYNSRSTLLGGAVTSATGLSAYRDSGSGFTDLYVQYRFHDWAHLTFGRHKMPFSMDDLTSSNDILALDRNVLAQAYGIRRQTGISVRGSGSHFAYNFALFRENPEHFNSAYDRDNKNNISSALRLTAWHQTADNASVHAGFSWANRNLERNNITSTSPPLTVADLDVFESEISGADLLVTGPLAYDQISLYGIEVAFSINSLYMKTELMEIDYDDVSATGGQDALRRGSGATLEGYTAELSWIITGEVRPYDAYTGTYSRPIATRKSAVGAWELFLRFSALNLDTDLETALPYAYSADDYRAWTLGFNWYPSNNVRIGVNYLNATIESVDEDGILLNEENDSGEAYMMRVQYTF